MINISNLLIGRFPQRTRTNDTWCTLNDIFGDSPSILLEKRQKFVTGYRYIR